MKYGLESEPKATGKYESQTNRKVSTSGFWVNPSYPFLGSSPDGLVGEDGIIKIKSHIFLQFLSIIPERVFCQTRALFQKLS